MNEPTDRNHPSASESPPGADPSTPELPVRLDGAAAIVPLSSRYEFGEVLGVGGMGTVIQCHDSQIGRDIALKRLEVSDPSAQVRFVREARLQGQLEHPAVPSVYELGLDAEGRAAFAMKRVRGITLRKVLSRLKWYPERYREEYSQRRLLAALSRVCLAVDYAHQRGVLHRDLKPGNLMLGKFGEITVIDWGLARLIGEVGAADSGPDGVSPSPDGHRVTRIGDVLGTPGYASPEQLEDATAALTPASDVYSLGAILFEILTGQALHVSSADQAIKDTRRGIHGSPRERCPDANIAPELDALCIAATRRGEHKRLQSARELHEGIERFLDGERDRERQKELAAQHIQRATKHLSEAASANSLKARKIALRELGRALALDPTSGTALETLAQLLSTPLKSVPDEVTEAMEKARIERTRRGARGAAVAYTSLLLYLPLVLWAGLRDPTSIIVLYVLTGLTALGVLGVARSRMAPPRAVLACMLLSTLAFAFTSSLFGALVMMPALIAVNTAAYGLVLERSQRAIAIIAGVCAVLIPAMLELFGIGGARYVFDAAGMHISPNAIELARTPSYILLIVASLGSVITGALSTAHLRDSLNQAELQLQVSAWQLRELSTRGS